MPPAVNEPPAVLGTRWKELKAAEPRLRIREAAVRLGTSEATLLSLQLGTGVRRLRCIPQEIIPRLEGLGTLMALTRNDAAVHERHGVYRNVKITGNVGLVANPDIDLRLDFSVWKAAFAEEKLHAGQPLRSLQFFDAQGTAVHKVYLKAEGGSRVGLWEALVSEFLDGDQESVFEPEPVRVSPPPTEPDAGLSERFLEAWAGLKDPHHFHALLKSHGMTRRQGLRTAEGRFTRAVEPACLDTLLQAAAAEGLPIMVFVANPGCVQIHTGTVSRYQRLGAWRNILDAEFDLHVDLDQVDRAWIVTKPSEAGLVTSVEFLGAGGELLVQFFGKRKPGEPERADWRALTERL